MENNSDKTVQAIIDAAAGVKEVVTEVWQSDGPMPEHIRKAISEMGDELPLDATPKPQGKEP